MTDKEFDFLADSLKQVGRSEFTLILEIDNKPIGFALCLPDINQALIYNKRGSLIGAGIRLLTKRSKINQLRIIVLGVLPEYQKTGVEVLLYYYIGESANKLNFQYGDAS